MFDHPNIEKYSYKDVPVGRELFLMDEKWMRSYEASLINLVNGRRYKNVGYISYAVVNRISDFAIELSWYPNTHTRLHEVRITLPRSKFVTCVGCNAYDERIRIFVKDAWSDDLYSRSFSVFALIDAIGVKNALFAQSMTKQKLLRLRNRIDSLAKKYSQILFISVADNVLLKGDWTIGSYKNRIKYTYSPEAFIPVIANVNKAFNEVLGLNTYAVLTQGTNEYYDEPLHHISKAGNHISLNSLGLPFAQLLSIDNAARKAVKSGVHQPGELYMDESFFRSLQFTLEFDKTSCSKHSYDTPLTGAEGIYYRANRTDITNSLKKR
ncbi:MAG: hypothetical protein AB7G15_02865 [Alphaproteobacteria bacterium]